MIENFALNVLGCVGANGKCVTLCCDRNLNGPGTALGETAEETVENFRRERANVIAESIKFESLNNSSAMDEERNFTAECAKCTNYQVGDFGKFDGLIHYVNLSMYPAPCQCKCFYCDFRDGKAGVFDNRLHADYHEKMLNVLDYVKNKGLVAADAVWQVSSGEITIHPFKNRIFMLVENQTAVFYTNCFIFEEKVAQNLAVNPRSSINLSIDSGTPETWYKVKGVDNFGAVMENLAKYHDSSAQDGQVTLKYIVLPGTNDNLNDYLSVVEIMKNLKIKHLTLSYDTRVKYTQSSREKENLISAAAYLVAILYKNGRTFDIFRDAPKMYERVVARAAKLVQIGKI